MAFVTSVTFAIDLSLQLVLVATVGGAVGGLGQVKDRSRPSLSATVKQT